MINTDLKTLKQLADELGVTKNKIAYQTRKLSDEEVVIIEGVKHLTKSAQVKIAEEINGLNDGFVGNKQEEEESLNTVKDDYIKLEDSYKIQVELLNNQIEILNKHIEKLDNQIAEKDIQINQLHNLMAIQSQQSGQKSLEHEDDENVTGEVRKTWFQRVFKK